MFLFKPSHHLLLSTQTLAPLFPSLSVLLFEHEALQWRRYSVGRTRWKNKLAPARENRKCQRVEARVYEIHNVIFSFRSRKVASGDSDVASSEQVLPLELDEDDDDDGFLVVKNLSFGFPSADQRRHSSFVREEREWVMVPRKSVDVSSITSLPWRSVSMVALLFLVWLSWLWVWDEI